MRINISAKYTGVSLIIISIALFFVTLSFTQHIQNLNQFLHKDCTIPDEICPFKQDICATPEGYTDDAWRQHMSHHPDMYAECFK